MASPEKWFNYTVNICSSCMFVTVSPNVCTGVPDCPHTGEGDMGLAKAVSSAALSAVGDAGSCSTSSLGWE